MKLQNRVLGLPSFKEEDRIICKLCTKCLKYYPMTKEYFHARSNVKCGFDSYCKECVKEKEKKRVRVPTFNSEGLLYCKKCKTYKSVDHFYPNSSTIKCRQYYSNNCKECEAERKKVSRELTYINDKEFFLKSLIYGCKTRALKENKFKFDLTLEQLLELWDKQNGLCAISGLEMTTIKGKGKMLLNASIDRIQPGQDYTISNVQLVCSHVNMMKSNLTEEELLEFCRAILKNQNINNV